MLDNKRSGNRGGILHSKLDSSSLNISSLVEVNEVVMTVSSD